MPGPDGAAARLQGLTPRERARLASILARLASPFESERAAAGLLATAFIEKHRLRWEDLISFLQPVPDASAPPDAAAPGQEQRRGGGKPWRGYCRRRRARLGQALSRTT